MNDQAYEVITFDCYGTLLDWETGITRAFQNLGTAFQPSAVPEAYNEIEPLVQTETYRRYRDVLGETARRICHRFGVAVTLDQAGFLAGSLKEWPPFPDTNPSLERLSKAGYRLGILSNIDNDLLAETLRHFSVDFEIVISAEDVRAYKPAPAHFQEARRRIGNSAWLHAAQSGFHDVAPAVKLGIPVAWVNRRNARVGAADATPDREVGTLAELADWLTPGR